MDVVILIPVLARPQRVEPLLANLNGGRPVFLVSPDDLAEQQAIEAAGADMIVVDWQPGQGDYARKINRGFAATDEEFAFLAADDLVFRAGWEEHVAACHERTGAKVISTNDLGNSRVISGEHATHPVVHRSYGELGTIDDPGLLLHEGYWHNFVDDEFIGTAKHRGLYQPCLEAVVEHLHPCWGKADTDATYVRALERFSDDHVYYQSRCRLWGQQPLRF